MDPGPHNTILDKKIRGQQQELMDVKSQVSDVQQEFKFLKWTMVPMAVGIMIFKCKQS